MPNVSLTTEEHAALLDRIAVLEALVLPFRENIEEHIAELETKKTDAEPKS